MCVEYMCMHDCADVLCVQLMNALNIVLEVLNIAEF